ncbi:MAG TPA: peptidase dimerization domain-containing protein [Myxococcota bacterium]
MRRSLAALTPALMASTLACATSAPSASAPSSTSSTSASIDIDPALSDDVTAVTAELVRERKVVDVLAARLEEAGVEVTRGAHGTVRAVVHANKPLAGKAAPPILLLADAAALPADASQWATPPFEGAIKGGHLIGRGAASSYADDALLALTLVVLARAEVPLAVDVVLLVPTVDAGVDGALADFPALAHAQVALAAGPAIVQSALVPGEELAAIAVAEKGILEVALSAHGDAGPASVPPPVSAADRVVAASARIRRSQGERPFTITKPTERELVDVGRAHGGVEQVVLALPRIRDSFALSSLGDSPSARALFQDTCALAVLAAGAAGAPDMIPGDARANLDCRLLPGTDPEAFRDHLLVVVDDPRVELKVTRAVRASGSDPDGRAPRAIAARIQAELRGAAVVTALSPEDTACRAARAHAIPCYGFVPIRLTREESDATRGKDEAVRTDELERGLSRVVDIVATLAAP